MLKAAIAVAVVVASIGVVYAQTRPLAVPTPLAGALPDGSVSSRTAYGVATGYGQRRHGLLPRRMACQLVAPGGPTSVHCVGEQQP